MEWKKILLVRTKQALLPANSLFKEDILQNATLYYTSRDNDDSFLSFKGFYKNEIQGLCGYSKKSESHTEKIS